MVMIQETWLENSIETVLFENYTIISRRDHHSIETRGGVIIFLRNSIQNNVSWKDSKDAARTWVLLHTDIGSIAIANWYRPGNSEDSHIVSLSEELSELKDEVIGVIIAGDININHIKWLHFSNLFPFRDL